MTTNGWIQILLFALIVIFALAKPLGNYMFRVFEGEQQPLPRFFGPIERWIYKLCGVDPKEQQDWKVTLSHFWFQLRHFAGDLRHRALAAYLAVKSAEFPPGPRGPRLQYGFELHHQYQLATYGGESDMSYLTQMAGLAWHNFHLRLE